MHSPGLLSFIKEKLSILKFMKTLINHNNFKMFCKIDVGPTVNQKNSQSDRDRLQPGWPVAVVAPG